MMFPNIQNQIAVYLVRANDEVMVQAYPGQGAQLVFGKNATVGLCGLQRMNSLVRPVMAALIASKSI